MSNSSLARRILVLRKSGQKDTHKNTKTQTRLSSKDVIYTVVVCVICEKLRYKVFSDE